MDPYIGKEINGQFRILQCIGSGGMGAVYKAEQPSMNRFVAVKILHTKYLDRPDLISRFRREARAMSQLSHPHTANVFLYGQLDDGALYFVMEYMEGKNLAQVTRTEGPMDPVRAINIMLQVCGALEEAHRGGIIHRDLKPENIFLTTQGGIRDFPKVLDFGLAKVTEKQMQPGSLILTQKGMVFGTPEFMSPEQAMGESLDPRSDIYSLAVILYELLSGKLPFDSKNAMEFIQLHVNATPILLTERAPDQTFPPGLPEVIMQAMAKRPQERFSSASVFAEALKNCIRGKISTSSIRAVPHQSSDLPASSQNTAPESTTPHDAQAQAFQHSSTHPTNVTHPQQLSSQQQTPESEAPLKRPSSFYTPIKPGVFHWVIFGLGILLAVLGIVALVIAFKSQG